MKLSSGQLVLLYAVELKLLSGQLVLQNVLELKLSSGQLVLMYAVELKLSSGQLVLLYSVDLKLSSGQLALLYAVELKLSSGSWCCHVPVWCIASLIGLSPILAVAVLRINALSPLVASLAGSSLALVSVRLSCMCW